MLGENREVQQQYLCRDVNITYFEGSVVGFLVGLGIIGGA